MVDMFRGNYTQWHASVTELLYRIFISIRLPLYLAEAEAAWYSQYDSMRFDAMPKDRQDLHKLRSSKTSELRLDYARLG